METTDNTQTELTPKVQVGKLVKKIREKNNLSVAEAAEAFHTTEESIIKFESGQDDGTKSDYYQRMFAIRFLKRMNEYNEENLIIIDQAYPQNIKEELKKSSQVSAGAGKSHRLKKRSNYEPSKKKSKKSRIKSIITFLIVLMLLTLGVFTLYKLASVRLKAEVENPTQLVENTALTPEKVTEEKVVEKTTKVEKGKIVDEVQEYSITELPEDDYELKLEITGDDYIAIYNEAKAGKTLADEKVYVDGDEIKLTIDKDVEDVLINVGAGKNAKIYVNDVKLDTSDFPSNQIYVRITNNVK